MVSTTTTTVVMSMALPEPLAGPGVGQRENKKDDGEEDHQKVEHEKDSFACL